MNLSNYVTSAIRTVVAVVVGTVVAYLVKKGVNVDEASVNSWLIPLCISGYYLVVRKLEEKFPKLGWLFGVAKAPGYVGAVAQPAPVGPVTDAAGLEALAAINAPVKAVKKARKR